MSTFQLHLPFFGLFSPLDLGSSFWGMVLILASTNLLTAKIAAGCFIAALIVVLFLAKNVRLVMDADVLYQIYQSYFCPDFSPFSCLATHFCSKSGPSEDSVLVSEFMIFISNKMERYWQFSHYSSWSMNIRIYCFYCCNLASARENNSPRSSLCDSLYWYVPIHPFSLNYLNLLLVDSCVISCEIYRQLIMIYFFRCDEQFVFSLWYTFKHLLYGLFSSDNKTSDTTYITLLKFCMM